jgi:cobalamin biosynthesis protein CobD/CbiB
MTLWDAPVLKTKNVVQLVWGIALVLAGIGVFFRIPYVMPKVEMIEQFAGVILFIRVSFYLLGFFLISGGAKKVFDHYKKVKD